MLSRNYIKKANMIVGSIDDNLTRFLRCWNVYSGLLYESHDGISRRMDATMTFSEMSVMLGGSSVEIYPGLMVTPDYNLVNGSLGEFDYIMGFSATFMNKPLGMITSVSHHGGKLIIVTEYMTLGFDKKWIDYDETVSQQDL